MRTALRLDITVKAAYRVIDPATSPIAAVGGLIGGIAASALTASKALKR